MGTVELVGRLLVSLAVVLGLIYFIAKRVRGGKGPRAQKQKLIDVLHRQQLGRSSSVAVVRVHDRALILGVTDANVQVLGDLELDSVQAALSLPGESSRQTTASRKSGRTSQRTASATTTATVSQSAGKPESISEVRARLGLADPAAPTPVADRPGDDDLYTGDDPVQTTAFDDELDAALRGETPAKDGMLAGSALSPTTWKQTIDALREMTVRKG